MERAGRRADHQATTLPVGLQSRSGRDSERCGTVGFWVGSPTAHGAPMLGHDDETARMGRREGGKPTARNGFTTSGLSCLTTLGGASGSNPGRWPPPRRGREPPPRRPRGRQPTSHDSAGPGQLQGDKTRPPRTSPSSLNMTPVCDGHADSPRSTAAAGGPTGRTSIASSTHTIWPAG